MDQVLSSTSLIGNVYYEDDPDHLIFRRVYPTNDDSELDDPKWVTEGVNPERIAVMIKVPKDSQEATDDLTGTA